MIETIVITGCVAVAAFVVRRWKQARRQEAIEEAELMDRITRGIEKIEQRNREVALAFDALISENERRQLALAKSMSGTRTAL